MAKKRKAQVNNIDTIKGKLLEALIESKGIVTTACKSAKISRTTFYNYCENDDDFARKVEDIQEIALDFVEGKLLEQIDADNITGIIFYLKTKGKKRGYVEKQEHDHNHKGKVPFQLIVEKTYESDADDTEEA